MIFAAVHLKKKKRNEIKIKIDKLSFICHTEHPD